MTRSSGRAPARARLAELMDGRRRNLRLTWDEVATRAGINRETLRQIRIGNGDIRPLSATGIEDALEWTRGSIEAVLDGGEPTPLETVPEDVPAEQPEKKDDIADALLDRIERDPRLQRRLRRILASGSGRTEEPGESGTPDTKGDAGRDMAG